MQEKATSSPADMRGRHAEAGKGENVVMTLHQSSRRQRYHTDLHLGVPVFKPYSCKQCFVFFADTCKCDSLQIQSTKADLRCALPKKPPRSWQIINMNQYIITHIKQAQM
jgi:hypothetical protein